MAKVAPRLSSSVVLLRDNLKGSGFQVLMAERSSNMKAFSGVYVFPGGVSEKSDGPAGARATSKKAGLRELFEEAGVLLTESRDGGNAMVAKSYKFNSSKEKKKEWQKKVHDNAEAFDEMISQLGVKPAIDSMAYMCTFITPVVEPRRFRTDFYVVYVGNNADVVIDNGETVNFQWLSPKEAIEKQKKGEIKFLPPQFFVLNKLLPFKTALAAVEAYGKKNAKQEAVEIQPHPIGIVDDCLALTYPGDSEHFSHPIPNQTHRVLLPLDKEAPPSKNGLPPFKGGFGYRCSLPNEVLTVGEWENVVKQGSTSKL